MDLKKIIGQVPNFPKTGITFYDIAPVLADPEAMRFIIDSWMREIKQIPDKIVAIDARGFVFGALLADALQRPLVMARKAGKLPGCCHSQKYGSEYSTGEIEIQVGAIADGDKVVVVDDLIATGGTLQAVGKLVWELGGKVQHVFAVIGLTFLPWRDKINPALVTCLVQFAGGQGFLHPYLMSGPMDRPNDFYGRS